MKNEINYYYNLIVEDLYKEKDNYYFYIGNIKYYLILYTKTIRELELILSIQEGYIKRNMLISEIILNKNSSYISSIDGNNYLLLKINEPETEKSLIEINNFDEVLKTNKKDMLGYTTWDILWGKKVDNYESRIESIMNKNNLVFKTFDYYVGMSENAISYVKNTLLEEKSDNLTIGHKRFNKEFNNIYNPFNLVIDYESRDIAEYIKTKFFNDTFVFSELENLLSKRVFSKFSIRLLFGRLLYPSYYFYVLDSIFKGENKDKELENIIKKSHEYESFLLEVYEYLEEFYMIPKVDWLYRKD